MKRKLFKTLSILVVVIACVFTFAGCSNSGAKISQEDMDKAMDVVQSVDEKYLELMAELKKQTEEYNKINEQLGVLSKEDAYDMVVFATNKIILNYNDILNNLKVTKKYKNGMGSSQSSGYFISNYFRVEDYSLVRSTLEDNDTGHISFRNGNKYIDSFYSTNNAHMVNIEPDIDSIYLGKEYSYNIRDSFEDAAYREEEYDLITKLYDKESVVNVKKLETGNYLISLSKAERVDGAEIVYITDYEISQEGLLIKSVSYQLTGWTDFEMVETTYEYGGVSEEEISRSCNVIAEILAYKEYVDSQE